MRSYKQIPLMIRKMLRYLLIKHCWKYSSLSWVVAVVFIKNGKVFDIEPMIRACKVSVLKEWKIAHDCIWNHSASATNMELDSAKHIWKHSLHQHTLQYTSFYGTSLLINIFRHYSPKTEICPTCSKTSCLSLFNFSFLFFFFFFLFEIFSLINTVMQYTVL